MPFAGTYHLGVNHLVNVHRALRGWNGAFFLKSDKAVVKADGIYF